MAEVLQETPLAPPPLTSSLLSDRDLLIRLDERTKQIMAQVDGMPGKYVSQHEFHPVRKIVYGLTSLLLTGIVVAAVGMLLKH